MIPMRQSGAAEQNAMLLASRPPDRRRWPPRLRLGGARRRRTQGNRAWLREVRREHGLGDPGDVVLIGGASLADFRIRVAQSHARSDLTPGYWSLTGLIRDRDELLTAAFEGWEDAAEIPATDAIVTVPLARFDDPVRYPNIAVLRFPGSSPEVLAAADRPGPSGAPPTWPPWWSTGWGWCWAPPRQSTRCSMGRGCRAPSWSSSRSG